MESPSNSSDRAVATSRRNICRTSKGASSTTRQNTPKSSLGGVTETGLSTQHCVNRESTSPTTTADDVSTAAKLCEILLSRGLGDPALTPPMMKSSVRTADHSRYQSLPLPSAELVRSVERVQSVPYLVDELRRVAVKHAQDARRETTKFMKRIEEEKQKARATTGSQLLVSLGLQDTNTDIEK